jgi:hypothetical protein
MCMGFPHGVEERQQRAHTGRQGHLRPLAGGPQAVRKCLAHRLVPHGYKGAQIESGPYRGASPPERPAAPEGAALPRQGRHPDQRGQPLAAQRAQLRQGEPQRPCPDRANAGDAAEKVRALTPHRPRPQRRVAVVLQRRQAGVAPGAMRREVRLEPWRGVAQAVLGGRPHGDQWPPPRQEGAARRGLGVWHGPGGRTHRGRWASPRC